MRHSDVHEYEVRCGPRDNVDGRVAVGGLAAAAAAGLVAAVLIGALAGLYPAMRAARLAPTDALRTA